MMAVGKPSREELALLEPFRGKVADEVFGEPFVPPVSDGLAPGLDHIAFEVDSPRTGSWAPYLGRCLRPAKLAKAARASSSKLEPAPAAQRPAPARRPRIASPTTSHR